MFATADDLLSFLTSRQHIRPHRTVREVLQDVCRVSTVCPVAADRAVDWLELSPDAPIGRLRRTQITQLARSIHRFWRAAAQVAESRG